MLLHHSVLYLAGRGLPGLINFAALMVYTRLLTPADYGKYALVIAYVVLANSLFFEWLIVTLRRFFPANKESGSLLSMIVLSYGAIVIFSIIICAPLVLYLTNIDILIIFLLLSWSQALFDIQLEIARARLSPKIYGTLAVSRALLSLILGIFLIWIGLGFVGLCVALIVSALIPAIWSATCDLPNIHIALFRKSILFDAFRYGLPLGVAYFFNCAVLALDRLLIAKLLGLEAAGRYAAIFFIAQYVISLVMLVVNLAAFPLAVHALEKEGEDRARRALYDYAIFLMVATLPLPVFFAVAGGNVTAVLLGPGFQAGSDTLLVLLSIATAMSGFRDHYLAMSFQLGRRTGMLCIVALATLVVYVPLVFYFLPRFGVVGAGYAAVTAQGFGLLCAWRLGRRVFEMPWPSGADAARIAMATAAMAGGIWALPVHHGWAWLVGQILLGGTTFLLVLWIVDLRGLRARTRDWLHAGIKLGAGN